MLFSVTSLQLLSTSGFNLTSRFIIASMGTASSKVARKLPKTPSAARAPKPQPAAWESRNEVIEKDAMDPHLLSNLSRLGPVRVDHHMETFKTENT